MKYAVACLIATSSATKTTTKVQQGQLDQARCKYNSYWSGPLWCCQADGCGGLSRADSECQGKSKFGSGTCPTPYDAPPATAGVSSRVTCGGGSWKHEVSWTLTCSDGTNETGGAHNYDKTISVAPGSTCNVAMSDSYGDGWNGNKWNGFGKEFTIASGSSGTGSFSIPADVTQTITANGGSWKHEIGWTLDCAGKRKAAGGATNGKSITLRQGEECKLNMTDSYGDGWNGNEWKGFGAECTIPTGSTGSCAFTVPGAAPKLQATCRWNSYWGTHPQGGNLWCCQDDGCGGLERSNSSCAGKGYFNSVQFSSDNCDKPTGY